MTDFLSAMRRDDSRTQVDVTDVPPVNPQNRSKQIWQALRWL